MQATADALAAAIDADASDHGAVLALADFLEGEGDERAHGLRWLVENGKMPDGENESVYLWWASGVVGKQHQLPLNSHAGEWYSGHESASAAYLSAAQELTRHNTKGSK